MTTVHMIYGYLGVGKTTFSKQLETSLPAIRFTSDHWMTHLYGIDPPADEMPEMYKRVSSLLEETWTKCVSFGIETVLDLNFWSLQQRAETREKAESLGAKVLLYSLPLPDDEAWMRVKNRNNDLRGSFYISKNTFEVLRPRFEPLTAAELKTAIVPNQ